MPPPSSSPSDDDDRRRVAALVEAHVRSFDDQVREAVTSRLASPLAG